MPRIRCYLFFLLCMTVLFLTGCGGQRPHNLGVQEGHLTPCPDSPNCVSSQSDDPDQAVEPLPLADPPDSTMAYLQAVVNDLPRTKIITASETYLYVEFKSALFRFVDDVEFFIDETAGQVHIRSASRFGYYDFGVNRGRVEDIRKAYLTAISKETDQN